jgi:hypothetical protein
MPSEPSLPCRPARASRSICYREWEEMARPRRSAGSGQRRVIDSALKLNQSVKPKLPVRSRNQSGTRSGPSFRDRMVIELCRAQMESGSKEGLPLQTFRTNSLGSLCITREYFGTKHFFPYSVLGYTCPWVVWDQRVCANVLEIRDIARIGMRMDGYECGQKSPRGGNPAHESGCFAARSATGPGAEEMSECRQGQNAIADDLERRKHRDCQQCSGDAPHPIPKND